MATDCSGLGVPELAMRMLLQETAKNIGLKHLWACDIFKPAQDVLRSLGVAHNLLPDVNERHFNMKTGRIFSKDTSGILRAFTKDDNLDVYIAGFLCTPFTSNGQQGGWADIGSNTFWSSLKTIKSLSPRIFVLENVSGINHKKSKDVFEKGLGTLDATYLVLNLILDNLDFGIPQHRNRVYVVGVLREAIATSLVEGGFSDAILKQFMVNKIQKVKDACKDVLHRGDFRKWLASVGKPITVSLRSAGSTMSSDDDDDEALDDGCTCSFADLCELHECGCAQCKKHGTAAKKCRWRQSMREHRKLQVFKNKKKKYIKLWRQVKNDSKLKRAPDYFELSRKKNIATSCISTPRKRATLRLYSECHNVMKETTVVNLAKTFGRGQFRFDGVCPTLGDSCGSFFVPSAGTYLSVEQLMCLSGFSPTHQKDLYQAVAKLSTSDAEWMIGNAMCLPAVGVVMGAALSLVRRD